MSDLNFKINRNRFLTALQNNARAISANSPIPALCGILIEAGDDGLTLTSSDADLYIRTVLSNTDDENLGLSILDTGSIVIDARYLLEIVKKIDSEDISVEVIDGTLTRFTGGKAEFKINGYRASDYPQTDASEPENSFQLAYKDLSDLINETVFAASTKETRQVLTGVNFKSDGTQIICTSTDSYRLARKILTVSAPEFNVTVPARSLNEVKGAFAGCTDIHVAVSDRKIQFQADGIMLQSRLLEGAYPETERLIPKEFSCELVINREALIRAIERSSFIKSDNIFVIRMQMNSAQDISISSKSQEIGESHEDLTAESYTGLPLDISFSGSYVAEAARTLSSENIHISFTGDMKPFVLTNEGEDQSLLQLVLPVRTYN